MSTSILKDKVIREAIGLFVMESAKVALGVYDAAC
jgi:hypothetical protein